METVKQFEVRMEKWIRTLYAKSRLMHKNPEINDKVFNIILIEF